MSVNDHASIDHGSQSFWTSAIPQAKGNSRVEGFETEEASSVAKRILSEATGKQTDAFVDAFTQALIQRLQKAPASSPLDFQAEVYDTVQAALQETFEKALYNGEKPKHQGRDLFTSKRAEAKAHSVAGDLVQGLFKEKTFSSGLQHQTLVDRLKKTLEDKLKVSAIRIPKDSQALQIRLKRAQEQRKEALTSRDQMTVGDGDKWAQISRSSQEFYRMITHQNPFQWRAGSLASDTPRMLELADHLCLRGLTTSVLSAFDQVSPDLAKKAITMLELASHAQGVDGDLQALPEYIQEHETDLRDFLIAAQACLDRFPNLEDSKRNLPPVPTLSNVETLVEAFKASKPGSTQHAKLGGELARMSHLLTIHQVREKLQTQVALAKQIFEDNHIIELTDPDHDLIDLTSEHSTLSASALAGSSGTSSPSALAGSSDTSSSTDASSYRLKRATELAAMRARASQLANEALAHIQRHQTGKT